MWVKDADGQVVAGKMDLPEGCYALPVDVEKQPSDFEVIPQTSIESAEWLDQH